MDRRDISNRLKNRKKRKATVSNMVVLASESFQPALVHTTRKSDPFFSGRNEAEISCSIAADIFINMLPAR